MQRGKFGLDAQYQYVDGNSYGESSRIANHPLGNERVHYNDETCQKSFGIAHNYRLGMNYAFSKNHRLEVAYTGKWDKSCSNSNTAGSSESGMHNDSHEYLHNVDVNYSLPFGLNINGSYTNYRTPPNNKNLTVRFIQMKIRQKRNATLQVAVNRQSANGCSRQTKPILWHMAGDCRMA